MYEIYFTKTLGAGQRQFGKYLICLTDKREKLVWAQLMIVFFRALDLALLPAPEARPLCFLLHMETKLLSENQSSLIPISDSITTIIMEVETFKSVPDNCALCSSLSTGQLASSNTYPGGEGQPSKSYKYSKSQISSSGSSRMLGVSIQGQFFKQPHILAKRQLLQV